MSEEQFFLAILTVDEKALVELVKINRALSKIFGGNKYNMTSWLTAENKEFEGMMPVEEMMKGGIKDVLAYLEGEADRGA